MRKNESNNKSNMVFIGSIISALVILGIFMTYAFLSAPPKIDYEKVDVETGDLKLVFEDNDNGINTRLAVEESITKKFTLENSGSIDASVDFDWFNLVNTYLYGSLVYKLSYSTTEDGEFTTVIDESNVPVSSEKLRKTLAEKVSIPGKTKYFFHLDIKLKNLEGMDQTKDYDSFFQSQIVIAESNHFESKN